MANPYKTPQSDVQISESISKTRWKVLFWIILVLQVASIPLLVMDPSGSTLMVVLELTVYPVIVLGLFGYAYDKRLASRRFWKAIIPVGISYDIYALYQEDWQFESSEELYFTLILLILIFLPLVFFQYLALFNYSFKSSEIWSKGNP